MGVLLCGQVRPIGLFEVLARNRQSAVGQGRRTNSALQQTPRVFTIPPRQQLSITIWLAMRRRSTTHARVVVVIIIIIIIIIIVIIIIVVEKQTQTREETFVLKNASKISLKPSDLSSSDRIQSSALFSLFLWKSSLSESLHLLRRV